MTMNNLCELNKTTDEFLNRHWPASGDFGERPTWISWESPFLRGGIPNNELGGCYALFIGEDLIYIGKGVTKATGGISRRLTGYVLRIKGHEGKTALRKLMERWGNITNVCTIGFSEGMKYLALSLESFLIREFAPRDNRR